jgi:hypothetical protein
MLWWQRLVRLGWGRPSTSLGRGEEQSWLRTRVALSLHWGSSHETYLWLHSYHWNVRGIALVQSCSVWSAGWRRLLRGLVGFGDACLDEGNPARSRRCGPFFMHRNGMDNGIHYLRSREWTRGVLRLQHRGRRCACTPPLYRCGFCCVLLLPFSRVSLATYPQNTLAWESKNVQGPMHPICARRGCFRRCTVDAV